MKSVHLPSTQSIFFIILSAWLALASMAVAQSLGLARGKGNPRPNIVLICVDDLGYNDLSVQGSARICTPHIDAIADSGALFTNGYCTAGTCGPSRAGMLTGRYQQRFGFEYNIGSEQTATPRGLAFGEETLADLLGNHYHRGLVGKWHLGYTDGYLPNQRGFDRFWGFLEGASSYFATTPSKLSEWDGVNWSVPDHTEYLTKMFADQAVNFIDECPANKPFFLYLAFNAPHEPLEAPEIYKDRADPYNMYDEDTRTYLGMILALDDAIGEVTAKLSSSVSNSGLEDNTLIFFVSDNGGLPFYHDAVTDYPADNYPLNMGKAFLFEGGVRVPFFMKWTGKIPAGTVSDIPVSTLDIVPTILTAARRPLPNDLDGINLGPITRDEITSLTRPLFWSNYPNRAIRYGDHKLIESLHGRWAFNLNSDVGETGNLHGSLPPDQVSALIQHLDYWEDTTSRPAWHPGPGPTVQIQGIDYDLRK